MPEVGVRGVRMKLRAAEMPAMTGVRGVRGIDIVVSVTEE